MLRASCRCLVAFLFSLSPSIHKFDDEFIPSGLSAERARTSRSNFQNTSPYLRVEALSVVRAGTQEETETKFYPVQLGPVQSFSALKFKGDYAELDFASGHLVTGSTPVGVTVVMLFGAGKLSLSVPAQFEAKVREAFGMYPVNAVLQSAYLRIAPKEYEALVRGVALQQANKAEIAKLAKEMYDVKFYGSFHAGALAILPPEDSRYIDAETKELGQVILEEGYFLKLTRIVPFVSIFPPGFENPKFMEKGK